jgi:2'-5' RNA ligase
MPTIGVAISIPDPHGVILQRRRAEFGDPQALLIPPHVTLLPPTDVEEEILPDLVEHLEDVAEAAAPFPMVLRGTGTFRPVSPVVFVQVSSGIGECELLEQAVRSGPVRRDLDFYYHPHVTVAHQVPEEALERAFHDLAGFEATFEVVDFHLYEHGTDGVWRPEKAFTMGSPTLG